MHTSSSLTAVELYVGLPFSPAAVVCAGRHPNTQTPHPYIHTSASSAKALRSAYSTLCAAEMSMPATGSVCHSGHSRGRFLAATLSSLAVREAALVAAALLVDSRCISAPGVFTVCCGYVPNSSSPCPLLTDKPSTAPEMKCNKGDLE